ncbi:MAG: Sec-independent protein translocase TatC [Acidimicrobiales bacterium]|nr:Sec-independent protein translocase TatC [Acidimicrobiales bacterium]
MTVTEMATPAPATDDGRMSLMDHLVELRGRIIKCVIAVAIGATLGWFAYPWVLHILIHPLEQISKAHSLTNGKLILTDPLEGFFLRVKISAYLGIGMAMPVVLYQLWSFVAPGLYANERKYALSFVATATVLFLSGAYIAYWTLPKALEFLQSVSGNSFVSAYTGGKYLTLIVYMMLAFGGGFEFPIVLIFLQLVGVVDSRKLRDVRRFAIVIIFVVAAVITPSADPFSLFALAIPMCIFYELSILFGRFRERRARKAAAA